MLRAVIFDFDGTLADTIPGITEGINLTMQRYGFPTHTQKEVRTYINNGPRSLIRRALPPDLQNDEKLLDRVLADYTQLYTPVCLRTNLAYDGMKALITRLRAHHLRIGVLSNKQDHLLREMCRDLFGDAVDTTVGTLPDLPTKPDPYLSVRISDELNVPLTDCVMIGDSDVDIRTAENAGMHHIGVSWGYRDRDFLTQNGARTIADTPDELYSLIAKML